MKRRIWYRFCSARVDSIVLYSSFMSSYSSLKLMPVFCFSRTSCTSAVCATEEETVAILYSSDSISFSVCCR